MIPQQSAKGGTEIPIPGVTRVPSYETDYLPSWRERNTYIREHGGTGYTDSLFVEVDLDSDDEDWLENFNGHEFPPRLPDDMFELLLWKLEVSNAAATDRALSLAGATPAERMSFAACSTTDHLPREEALQMLEESCSVRDTIRVTVYDYWLQKRQQLGQPILRRLQAPTPPNDNNPYNVFRPRERVNRPQTRRRRENNDESLEKLRMIRENITRALDLFEYLVKRENRKRDLVFMETDSQQLQLKLRHWPKLVDEAEYLAAAKAKIPRRPIGFNLPPAVLVTTNALLDYKNSKNKKRRAAKPRAKKLGEIPILNAVAQLPPPPLCPQQEFLFAQPVEVSNLPLSNHTALDVLNKYAHRGWTARIGRGGRLMVDRSAPFDPPTPEREEEKEDELSKPLHERANPYAAFLTAGGAGSGARLAPVKVEGARLASPPATVVKLKLPLATAAAAAAEDGEETPHGARMAGSQAGSTLRSAATSSGSGTHKRGPGRPPKTVLRPF
ncbi:hypothetical protein H632_c221p0 [Helicosporidium sp. ATCC 50920]|nr:hypothetical protein H632_c221p0 [Helicosporidium sp. ATCC 50920]|eukprot:KDD76451.1 hypothetical protein H632_c221p0 [Helicosporidium sp. ATCC 50920]